MLSLRCSLLSNDNGCHVPQRQTTISSCSSHNLRTSKACIASGLLPPDIGCLEPARVFQDEMLVSYVIRVGQRACRQNMCRTGSFQPHSQLGKRTEALCKGPHCMAVLSGVSVRTLSLLIQDLEFLLVLLGNALMVS